MASPAELPEWLVATWSRNYIRRAGPDGQLGERSSSIAVRYLQTQAGGHAFDLRIAEDLELAGEPRSVCELNAEQLTKLASIECFAGVTTAEPRADGAWTVSWHGAFTFPPQLGDGEEPLVVLSSIAAGTHQTSDVGVSLPTTPGRGKPVVHWLEHAPDASYEEEWVMLDSYFKQGAHLAALRPAARGASSGGACWLAILGNTFGFVRDIDRRAVLPAVRNRPIAEVLADEAVALETKQQLLDCEFSFGFFGQGGGVGGVVERSSHPWRRGTALATLIGDAEGWEPIRPSDAPMLSAAIATIRQDHEKACQGLRDANADGHEEVARLLRARGAVP